MERVGGKNTKTATAKHSAAGPNPKWMRKKEKRKRNADGPDPEEDTGEFRSNYSKPLSHPCRRQADGAKPATWVATLAPSQAGANNRTSDIGHIKACFQDAEALQNY